MGKKVVFIGAGNVAFHLSHALSEKGYRISGIFSKKKSSAKRLASSFRANYAIHFDDSITDSDLLFITTPDGEIEKVAKDLCKAKVIRRNHLLIHTSGLLGVESLTSVEKFGAIPLSMHPAYSFSSRSYKKNELKGVWFVLEGTQRAISEGKKITRVLGGKTLVLRKGRKHLYHLALVFASNLFVGIEDISLTLLEKCGIKKRDGLEVIRPLVGVTEKNIWKKGTEKALTGPIERGDIETIEGHLKSLSHHARSYKKVYMDLSRHLLKLVESKGEVDKKTLRKLREILKG
jgi:predicted short-subunit dehydrogenase-like oxidoreductase (DUF2520 family)